MRKETFLYTKTKKRNKTRIAKIQININFIFILKFYSLINKKNFTKQICNFEMSIKSFKEALKKLLFSYKKFYITFFFLFFFLTSFLFVKQNSSFRQSFHFHISNLISFTPKWVLFIGNDTYFLPDKRCWYIHQRAFFFYLK